MRALALLFLSLSLALTSLQAQNVSNFVSLSPCRIADTRDSRYGNGLGPPFMPAHSTRDFPVLASNCGMPSTAIAYSLNITVIPRGPVLYVSVWPTGQKQPEVSTLNSPSGAILANAAIVPAGTNGAISIYTHGDTDVLIDINGYFIPYVAPTIPAPVTVTLPTIVDQSSTAANSLAIGTGASSGGNANTAVGSYALNQNNGASDTALGSQALGQHNVGSSNVAVGVQALFSNTNGTTNTGIGTQSLFSNTVGNSNVALGFGSLMNLAGGNNNIGIGSNAGANISAQLNDNIEIGSSGEANDAYTTRIGTDAQFNGVVDPNTQLVTYPARSFIAGVTHTTNPTSGMGWMSAVFIDPKGQLGVLPSSARYKEDIHSLTDESDKLQRLRPVAFRYKQPAADGSKPVQYGLIAEEVDQVYPELVVHNERGQVEAVQYQLLPALLLKQIQKQEQTIEELQRRLRALEAAK